MQHKEIYEQFIKRLGVMYDELDSVAVGDDDRALLSHEFSDVNRTWVDILKITSNEELEEAKQKLEEKLKNLEIDLKKAQMQFDKQIADDKIKDAERDRELKKYEIEFRGQELDFKREQFKQECEIRNRELDIRENELNAKIEQALDDIRLKRDQLKDEIERAEFERQLKRRELDLEEDKLKAEEIAAKRKMIFDGVITGVKITGTIVASVITAYAGFKSMEEIMWYNTKLGNLGFGDAKQMRKEALARPIKFD